MGDSCTGEDVKDQLLPSPSYEKRHWDKHIGKRLRCESVLKTGGPCVLGLRWEVWSLL